MELLLVGAMLVGMALVVCRPPSCERCRKAKHGLCLRHALVIGAKGAS